MSILAGGAAAATSIRFTGLTAALAASAFGYDSTTGGSLSRTKFKNATIDGLTSPTTNDFRVVLTGASAPPLQNVFYAVRVVDSGGVARTYLSSAASYSNFSNTSVWNFGAGASRVYSAAGQTIDVQFRF
jgi:hypothetical protein